MLKDAIDALDDVAWVADVGPPVRIRYLGAAYERVFGLPVAGCYADPWDWLGGVHPDDRDRVAEAFREGIKAGAVDVTHRVLRPDGSTRWIRKRCRVVVTDTPDTDNPMATSTAMTTTRETRSG